jgi:hypothetical protein
VRTPHTRSRFRVEVDPEASDKALKATLASLKLYSKDILGDGNCLFRALR